MIVGVLFLYGIFLLQFIALFVTLVLILGVRSLPSYVLIAVGIPLTLTLLSCQHGCPNMGLKFGVAIFGAAIAFAVLYWLALRRSTGFFGSAPREGESGGIKDFGNAVVLRGLSLPIVLVIVWGVCYALSYLPYAVPGIRLISNLFGHRPFALPQNVALFYLAAMAIVGFISRRWLLLPGLIYGLWAINVVRYQFSDHPRRGASVGRPSNHPVIASEAKQSREAPADGAGLPRPEGASQ